jgi:hypothetical protein
MESTRKLDVTRIVLSAILAPIVHRRRILWFATPLIVVELAKLSFGEISSVEDAGSAGSVLGIVALSIASYVAWLLLAVASHRLFILGEGSLAGQGIVRWTSRETRFLSWTVGLGLIAACFLVPIFLLVSPLIASDDSTTVGLAGYVLALPVMYVFTRLSLVLPAAATDMNPDFGWAWRASKGNGIRLTVVIVLLPLLFQSMLAIMPEVQALPYNAMLSLVGIYIVVVEIAALSTSYRVLAQDLPAPASQLGTFE